MLALIDGDTVAYRCAAASENDEEWVAISRCNESIERILGATKADECQVWLSDSADNNFRYKLYPAYKANRPPERPRWLGILKNYLSLEWMATVAGGQEADDALGIAQFSSGKETIICANDKDMLMIPGHHYNFVRETYLYQDEVEAIRHFYKQCMSGDRVDNIVKPAHLKGFGTKKIDELLNCCDNEADMFTRVREMYGNDEALRLNGRLLWVRRKENELWDFPTTQQETEDEPEYSSWLRRKSDHLSVATSMEKTGDPKAGSSMEVGTRMTQDLT